MRESKIEKALVDEVKAVGGRAYKFVSPGRSGVPDRLCLLPVPERLRKTIAKYVYFVECKAPGKKPRIRQQREAQELRDLGYRVDVKDRP
jgi:hypothetical protein